MKIYLAAKAVNSARSIVGALKSELSWAMRLSNA
jgi:hypothetical protein